MGRVDQATVDRIYAAANIVEVVSDFISLKRKGVNYQACCPFHNEKTPSFVVSPAKGLFKCFGCGKGGNAVTFVMEHENMSYVEALKYVGKKYGIEVQEREQTEEEIKRNDDRESMMVVNSFAAEYFSRTLNDTDEGLSVGKSYLRGRGFTDATIRKFGLGFCPSKGDSFTSAALAAGYKEEFLTATGLTIKRESGGYYDRFCDRVMFPIHSISGRVVAFGGRTLRTDKNVAKYQNSPESEVYDKSNSLYGIYFAKRAITQENYCILVEGYTDVIQMHQSGVENVVASSGTSLTTGQIKLISRFTHNITVIYDGDSAGIKASLRGIDMILAEGMNVRIVLLPPEDDPDSFAKNHSSEQVKKYIADNEVDFIRFKTNLLLSQAGNDPLKKAALIRDIVESIAVIPDEINRSVFIKDCARNMDIDEQVLVGEVGKRRSMHQSDSQTRDYIASRQQQITQQQTQLKRAVTFGTTPMGSSIDSMEREMTADLLKFGHLYFEYTSGDITARYNVARLVFDEMSANGLELLNSCYKAIYDCYKSQFELSGEGVKVGEHHFTTHPDPAVCDAAIEILTSESNYEASKLWERHDVFIETQEEKLSESVPQTINLYISKRIELIIAELKHSLADQNLSDQQMASIMMKINALNRERTKIAKKSSRVII